MFSKWFTKRGTYYKRKGESCTWFRAPQIHNSIALKEAIINAFVHNDYTREIAPKFEIFSDRIEITSAGSLPHGLSAAEFFEGISFPRNKELMRIFKDLDLVEQLGSGIPRILESYSKDSFYFFENFLRMVFPSIVPVHQTGPDTIQVKDYVMQDNMQVPTPILKVLKVLKGEQTRQEIQESLKMLNRNNFRKNYLRPALEQEFVEMTIPNKPNSKHQRYRLTGKGKGVLQFLVNAK